MKNLLATTAVAIVATAGAASAQSVLERVLSEIDNSTNLAQVNGTFANIAENVGGTTTAYRDVGTGVVLTASEYNAEIDAAVAVEYDSITTSTTGTGTGTGDTVYNYGGTTYTTLAAAQDAAAEAAQTSVSASYDEVVVAGGGIDGSIDTTINGVTAAVAEATQMSTAGTGTVAYEWNLPTVDIGTLSTTALGAVNDGTITLGVNSTVDEAKTTSTQAVSSVMNQLGGSTDTGALVLNVASNMTAVDGSISTVMADVGGTLDSASTTVLGAVNTGAITSGVNAAVNGITGTSGSVTP